MKTSVIICLTISVLCVVMSFGNIPDTYVAYPNESAAAMKFVNYSGDGLVNESHAQFKLITSLSACTEATLGHVDIKADGTIAVCKSGGWVLHTPH